MRAVLRPGFLASFVAGWMLVITALPARACGPVVEIDFYESSPDIMSIHNRSEEAWSLVSLTFNLGTSAGSLIFDTVFGGAGENIPSDFDIIGGTARLAATPKVSDGDVVLLMLFASFGPGQNLEFTVDLDDRLVDSVLGQAIVVGSEIAGARVDGILRDPKGNDMPVRGIFNDKAQAQLTSLSCV
ncbi:MAG: hypothetical protein JJ900_12180 [Rhodospirillales bacterium]|nr:hypothetical protein [Rhodospirillales bacterium]MBO6787601.1 hypothetical protein [Rhodospirillales bacterium]